VPVLLVLMRAERRDETQVRRESSNTIGDPTQEAPATSKTY
jgi:hypothetical protein